MLNGTATMKFWNPQKNEALNTTSPATAGQTIQRPCRVRDSTMTAAISSTA